MKAERLASQPLNILRSSIRKTFPNKEDWLSWIAEIGISDKRHIRIATEGALFAGAFPTGLREHLTILSDDARQFNVHGIENALCWIHEERHLKDLVAMTEAGRIDQKDAIDDFWALYKNLNAYRDSPTEALKKKIHQDFDELFTRKTCFASLNRVLKRANDKKKRLLVFLDKPIVPLHNNASENDIREFVKRRKVSGGTRSTEGKRCRDTFASLKKTCRKQKQSFWDYLNDRISGTGNIPMMAELILKSIQQQAPPAKSTNA